MALAYVIALLVAEDIATVSAVKCTAFLLLPLALIWFPQELGEATGYFWRGSQVNSPSPAVFVGLLGWVFLAGVPATVYILF